MKYAVVPARWAHSQRSWRLVEIGVVGFIVTLLASLRYPDGVPGERRLFSLLTLPSYSRLYRVASELGGLGAPYAAGLFCLMAALVLFRLKNRLAAITLLMSVGMATVAEEFFKFVVDRPPPPPPWKPEFRGPSFPSGHAAIITAIVVCGLGLILRHKAGTRDVRRSLIGCGLVLVVVTSVSRVVIGVHHPSDVLAGICLGVVAGAVSLIVHDHLSDQLEPVGEVGLLASE